jgi:hypothetical protein
MDVALKISAPTSDLPFYGIPRLIVKLFGLDFTGQARALPACALESTPGQLALLVIRLHLNYTSFQQKRGRAG